MQAHLQFKALLRVCDPKANLNSDPQPGKSHDYELLAGRHRTQTVIAPVTPYALIEPVLEQTLHQLGENCAAIDSWASVAEGQPAEKLRIAIGKLKSKNVMLTISINFYWTLNRIFKT